MGPCARPCACRAATDRARATRIEQREERDDDEARVRDDLVVGHAVGALAVVWASAERARPAGRRRTVRSATQAAHRSWIVYEAWRMKSLHARTARRRDRGAAAGPPAGAQRDGHGDDRRAARGAGRPRRRRRRCACSCSRPPASGRSAPAADLAEQLDRAGRRGADGGFAGSTRRSRPSRRRRSASAWATCVGAGAEIAAGCDLRVGGDNLKLSWPGARLGVPVGPARLVPLVGLARGQGAHLHRPRRRRWRRRASSAAGALRAGGRGGGARRWTWPPAIAAHPSAGLRGLKEMFRDYEDTPRRVADENGRLVAFQRDGAGLPMRCVAAARDHERAARGRPHGSYHRGDGRADRIRPRQGHRGRAAAARASRSSSSAATGMTLAGRNGAGKTTLLRMLAGRDVGRRRRARLRRRARGSRCTTSARRASATLTLRDYVLSGCARSSSRSRQELARLEQRDGGRRDGRGDARRATRGPRRAGARRRLHVARARDWRTLHGLGFGDDDLDRALQTFSGGELTRGVAGAGAGRRARTCCCSTSPRTTSTSRRSSGSSSTLVGLDAAVVLVAHDRWFLEAVGTAVLELEAGRSRFFAGPWHAWRKEQAARELALGRAIDKQQAEIERLERFVERFRAKATKARQAQSRVKKLDEDRADRARSARTARRWRSRSSRPSASGRVIFELERRAHRGRREPHAAARGRRAVAGARRARLAGRAQRHRQDDADRDARRPARRWRRASCAPATT